MSDNEDIFTKIKPPPKTQYNEDLDKLNAKHQKTIHILDNLYENITHKTTLLILALAISVIYIFSRYLLLEYPNNNILKTLNKDSAKIMSYFVTAVASWFVTKNLEK